jgi:small-conductance mechanosensitive channel
MFWLVLTFLNISCVWQVGSVNRQVVEMGLHTTQLLNSDKFPIVVPNSFFSNQVIVFSVTWFEIKKYRLPNITFSSYL